MSTRIEDERANVMSKVRALLAKTVEAGCTAEEAQSAAYNAQRLLAKHNIDVEELRLAGEEVEEPIDREFFNPRDWDLPLLRQRSSWRELLAATIARAYGCELLIVEQSNCFWFVGKAVNRAIAMALYVYLHRVQKQMSMDDFERTANNYDLSISLMCQQYPQHPLDYLIELSGVGARPVKNSYRESWLLAFVVAIRDRLRNLNNEPGLVLISKDLQRAKEFLEDSGVEDARPLKPRQHDERGYAHGYEQGNKVNISTNVIESSVPEAKRIKTSSRLLA